MAFGGGHGLYSSLTALRRLTDQLTAVVTVADDGGSSGRLRSEFEILPPGDLRMALAALCGDDALGRKWAAVLQSRFKGDGPLAGHAIGNLLIAGLWQQFEDPVAGLDMVGQLLRTRGRVLPMSAVPLTIEADVVDLDPDDPDELFTLNGQSTVAKTTATVQSVRLLPDSPPAHPEAVKAVLDADALVLGPGSWFTSVIPHLLVPELAEAIRASEAYKVLILNVTSAHETRGLTPSQHLDLLAEHAPLLRLDAVIAPIGFGQSDPPLAPYIESLGGQLVEADVQMRDGSARHDPLRLASILTDVLGI